MPAVKKCLETFVFRVKVRGIGCVNNQIKVTKPYILVVLFFNAVQGGSNF